MNLESLPSVRHAVSALYRHTSSPYSAEPAYCVCYMCLTIKIYTCVPESLPIRWNISLESTTRVPGALDAWGSLTAYLPPIVRYAVSDLLCRGSICAFLAMCAEPAYRTQLGGVRLITPYSLKAYLEVINEQADDICTAEATTLVSVKLHQSRSLIDNICMHTYVCVRLLSWRDETRVSLTLREYPEVQWTPPHVLWRRGVLFKG